MREHKLLPPRMLCGAALGSLAAAAAAVLPGHPRQPPARAALDGISPRRAPPPAAAPQILSHVGPGRQTLLFSATMPKALAEFARAGLKDPELVRRCCCRCLPG